MLGNRSATQLGPALRHVQEYRVFWGKYPRIMTVSDKAFLIQQAEARN